MISQPIDQKPIAETLTGQEGDNIIVPDDEVWYVTLDSRNMLAKIQFKPEYYKVNWLCQ